MIQVASCSVCKLEKPVDQIVPNSGRRCKACISVMKKVYRDRNKEALKERKHKFYIEHKEAIFTTQKRYVEANKLKTFEYQRRYRLDHPEEVKIYAKRWRQRHPEACKAKLHRRRACLLSVGGVYLTAAWEVLKDVCDHRCLCCGQQESNVVLSLDHVIPIVAGGPNTIDNFQPLCRSCNSRKHSKSEDYRSDDQKVACEWLQFITRFYVIGAVQPSMLWVITHVLNHTPDGSETN